MSLQAFKHVMVYIYSAVEEVLTQYYQLNVLSIVSKLKVLIMEAKSPHLC